MITWYKSKHNKFNSISGSRYGFLFVEIFVGECREVL